MSQTQSLLLLQLNGLVEGQVVKRPSKYIKTPYVADVKCIESDEEVLAHTAALGCCGLADINASVLMTLSDSKTKPKNSSNENTFMAVNFRHLYI